MIKYSTHGYLSPADVKAHDADDGTVEVRVYEGLFEMSPDPRIPDKVAYALDNYNAGQFFRFKICRVNPGDLPEMTG